jgi:transposase
VDQPVQYSERVKSNATYLHIYQLLPYARTCEAMWDLFGCGMSPGTLNTSEHKASTVLKPVEDAIRQKLVESPMVHFDETGIHINGKSNWLHVASTAEFTLYGCYIGRGRAAMDAMGVLPHYQGRAIHDALQSYFGYGCAHGLCNVHLLRDLTFVEEAYKQDWAKEGKALLREIKTAVDKEREERASREQMSQEGSGGQKGAQEGLGAATVWPTADATEWPGLPEDKQWEYRERYRSLVEEGLKLNPEPACEGKPKRGRKKQGDVRNLLLRLQKHEEAILAFMTDLRVPFDNNQAERDIRMMKGHEKISGGFRSTEGAQEFCRIRGYISTLRKQGQNVLSGLAGVCRGAPIWPRLLDGGAGIAFLPRDGPAISAAASVPSSPLLIAA